VDLVAVQPDLADVSWRETVPKSGTTRPGPGPEPSGVDIWLRMDNLRRERSSSNATAGTSSHSKAIREAVRPTALGKKTRVPRTTRGVAAAPKPPPPPARVKEAPAPPVVHRPRSALSTGSSEGEEWRPGPPRKQDRIVFK
jgi:hypothetical protein